MAKIPVTELSRRMCIAAHRADLSPNATAINKNVPCSEHRRLGQLYYGLLDSTFKPLLDVIFESAAESNA